MCETCGCGHTEKREGAGNQGGHEEDVSKRHAVATRKGGAEHKHDHVHGVEHRHESPPSAESDPPERRLVSIEQRVLARNDEIAESNRKWLAERGVVALNLISSPGSGKTLLLERTLERLRGRVPCAVITGDQQTDLDAQRLSGKGAHVHGIQTGSACHLNAAQVAHLLPHVVGADTRLLFIENVGNLVCPAAYDLGESFKVALLSTPEGEDKPLKYPALFARAGVVVINKMDLAAAVGWDAARARQCVRRVHPGVFIFELSAKTGEGLDAWIEYLIGLV